MEAYNQIKELVPELVDPINYFNNLVADYQKL